VYGASKTPLSSINFITAHDGYSLRDLVTYQMKHNYENGEMNQDGANQNDNWNCGAEGPTLNAAINHLREKQLRNFFLALFLSQGIPMLLMGDEYGHSRKGNNNPFVQDNEINWFLWNLLPKNKKIFSFVAALIAFRKKHQSLRHDKFLTDKDIQWHGSRPFQPDFGCQSQFIAFMLQGTPQLYVAFNAHNHETRIELPGNTQWEELIYTEKEWDKQNLTEGTSSLVASQIVLAPYSALLARQV
jgi:isoamylase/glycogen operon protein